MGYLVSSARSVVDKKRTFVAVRAAEQVGDDVQCVLWRMLGRKTDNADTVKEGEDVGRDHLVAEHDGEGDPEELHSLLVAVGIEMKS